jgi:streptomycin 6-kinase
LTSLAPALLAPDVAANVCRRWPDIGPAWCGQVEQEFADLCERYDARPVGVMRSRYGLVVEVVADGIPLVFRGSPDPAGDYQGRVTQTLAELGVGPAVHAFIKTDTGTWAVTERIFPGTPIGDMDPRTLDLDAVCAMLRPLVGQPAPVAGMPTVAAWLRERLTDDMLADLAPGLEPAPVEQRRHALAILTDLDASGSAGLCHGDASPWNLLLGNLGRLILIDSRGFAGEVAYDIAVIGVKAACVVPPMISVPHLAQEVGADPERALAWLAVADAARV